MGIRKNVVALAPAELDGLRRAFTAAYGFGDERGYAYFAGLHGLPLPSYCQHGTALFLPWHRAYLYFFERALQDLVAGTTLPWWDWSSPRAHRDGLPAGYRPPARGRGANPLASGPVTLGASDLAAVRASLPGAITAGRVPDTGADPDDPDELPKATTVQRALGARTFNDFTSLVEGIHNGVHVWTGGAMSAVPIAAYDPVFWAHHAMIDRLWYVWQLSPNGANPPAELLGRALAPFPLTVRDVLDVGTLGVEYAAQVVG